MSNKPIRHGSLETVPCDHCGQETEVYHLWGGDERALRLCPPCSRKWERGIKRGVQAVKEGKVRPWEEVKKELGIRDV